VDWQTILSLGSLVVVIITVAVYFDGKIKDAESRGILKQRVNELEAKQIKNEATKDDITAILIAIGNLTSQISSLQKEVEALKDDVQCIERRKIPG